MPARCQQKSNPARDALRLPEPCSQLEHRSAVKGSRQKAANRSRRHTPIDIDCDGRRTAEVYPKGGDRVDWVATATQIADCLTKSMKPTYMLKVLSTCQYQISREGYSKPSAGGNATVPKGQETLESAQAESAAVGSAVVKVTSGKTTREQVGCERTPVSQSCRRPCCS